jgi:hypothetical protein
LLIPGATQVNPTETKAMRSNKLNVFLLAVVAGVGALNTGCDGLADETADELQLITCAPGTMRLEGMLDGMPIAISQTSETGGWAQTEGGEFGSQDNIGNTREPSLADVELQWVSGITVGRSTSVTGFVVMPTGSPFAGETFCSGEGSIVRSAGDGELQWVLRNVTGGGSCAVPVAGELRGCFQ